MKGQVVQCTAEILYRVTRECQYVKVQFSKPNETVGEFRLTNFLEDVCIFTFPMGCGHFEVLCCFLARTTFNWMSATRGSAERPRSPMFTNSDIV